MYVPHPQKLNVRRLVRRQEQQRAAVPSHPRGAPDPVHERRRVLRRVELDDPVDARDVQTPRRHVGAQQTSPRARREPTERLLALRLLHLAVQRNDVDVVAGGRGRAVAHGGGEVVDARAGEKVDDGLLVRVFLEELSETPEPLVDLAHLVQQLELRRELTPRRRGVCGQPRRFRRVRRRLRRGVPHRDPHGVAKPRPGQFLNLIRLRGAEQPGAALLGQPRDDGVDGPGETHAEEPVRFVEDEELASLGVERVRPQHEIVEATWGADERSRAGRRERSDVLVDVGASDEEHGRCHVG